LSIGLYPCIGLSTSCASGNTGNILTQTIAAPGLSLTQSYIYDAVHRLTTAGEGSSSWSQSYGYDTGGNRWVSQNAGIHYLTHNPEIEAARRHGQLQPGSFVSLRAEGARRKLTITDYGNAEALLSNTRKLHSVAREVLNEGGTDGVADWGGWFGRFHVAIAQAEHTISRGIQRRGQTRS
jgi:hypothetical protein